MKQLLYFNLGFLGLLLGVCGLLSLGITLVRTRLTSKTENENLNDLRQRIVESTKKERLIRPVIRVSFLLIGLVVGFFTGYFTRELRQYRNTVVVTDLHVIEQQSSDVYLMESKNHLPFV